MYYGIESPGKTAFVTGGNIGIGRAVSMALARCGADVALTYYSHKQEGEETVEAISKLGQKAMPFSWMRPIADQVKDVVDQVAEDLAVTSIY